MSALPLDPGPQQNEGPGESRAGRQWPLLPTRSGSSWFASTLGSAGRRAHLAQLPADLLIGLPMAVVERTADTVGTLRRWIARG